MIVAFARTPFTRRGGALAGLKGVELLRHVLREVLNRAGITPSHVDQVVGGCVTQSGEQSLNVTRNAWLNAGFDPTVGCTTVDVSCGSSQQANHIVASMIASGMIDVGIGCGVETMSRVPMGTNLYQGPGHYKAADYPWDDPPSAQFGAAERIALRDNITRNDADSFGYLSQVRAQKAWDLDAFQDEIAPITARDADGASTVVTVDEGLRATTLETLAKLRSNVEGGIHTAGTTSQVSDGAAAILWMSQRMAESLGLAPRAQLRCGVVTGCDPYYLLDGPTIATEKALKRERMALGDIEVAEINEAFAGVVLSWLSKTRYNPDLVNRNGGAIALGHPLGATGTRLLMTAVTQMEASDASTALVAMCCGGALGTATILERT